MNVLPRLVIRGADEALEFYRQALGAEVTTRYTAPNGSVVHAEMRVGDSLLTVKDEDDVDKSAASYGGSPVLFILDVEDADAVARAITAAGGTVVFPVADQSHGYRQGRLADPFGFQWILNQDIEELTPGETQARLDAELS